ncbi:hypothetical protein [Shumkonia mesophila]|uniref:hypothetical protein n=1 Tax=Shumkonia mesophila TaxID=2838854 RepID=UPI0029352D2A|nr:hypothetical protein [Shumkonia mesophila]
MRLAIIICSIVFAGSGCVTTDPGTVKDVTGKVISSSGFEKIGDEQSKIKYIGQRSVEERTYVSSNDARYETIKLNGMPVFYYSSLYGERDWNHPPKQSLENRIESQAFQHNLDEYGAKGNDYSITKRKTKHGTAYWASVSGTSGSCMILILRFGRLGWSHWSGGTSEIRAVGCGKVTGIAAERAVNDVFAEIDNLEFVE